MVINYVEDVMQRLSNLLPRCPVELLDLYSLLVLTTGKATTLENIHDAWSIWQNASNPQHKSLTPFAALSIEVQELDRKYMEAVHTVAAQLTS